MRQQCSSFRRHLYRASRHHLDHFEFHPAAGRGAHSGNPICTLKSPTNGAMGRLQPEMAQRFDAERGLVAHRYARIVSALVDIIIEHNLPVWLQRSPPPPGSRLHPTVGQTLAHYLVSTQPKPRWCDPGRSRLRSDLYLDSYDLGHGDFGKFTFTINGTGCRGLYCRFNKNRSLR